MGGSMDALFGLPQGGILAASFRVRRAQLVYVALLRLGVLLSIAVRQALCLRPVSSGVPALPRALTTSLYSPLHLGF